MDIQGMWKKYKDDQKAALESEKHLIDMKTQHADKNNKENTEVNKYLKEVKQQKDLILQYLSSMCIKNIDTNEFCFNFDYKGYRIHFVNQPTRNIVTLHEILTDPMAIEIADKLYLLEYEDADLYKEISNEFKYQHIYLEGDPLDGVKKVIGMIE